MELKFFLIGFKKSFLWCALFCMCIILHKKDLKRERKIWVSLQTCWPWEQGFGTAEVLSFWLVLANTQLLLLDFFQIVAVLALWFYSCGQMGCLRGSQETKPWENLETIFGCKSFVLNSGQQCILPSNVETACVCLVFVYWPVGCGLHSTFATALLPRWMWKASGPSPFLAFVFFVCVWKVYITQTLPFNHFSNVRFSCSKYIHNVV